LGAERFTQDLKEKDACHEWITPYRTTDRKITNAETQYVIQMIIVSSINFPILISPIYNHSMTKIQRLVLLGLILLLAGISAAWWLLTPRVIQIFPENNEVDVIPSSQIEMEFNVQLAEQDVSSSISLSPDLPYTAVVEENKVILSPVNALPEGEEISISILPGIKSALGIPSVVPAVGSFRVKNAWLLYLLDGEKKTDLYRIDPAGLVTDKLFDIEQSLVDYHVIPDGTGLVYAARAGNNTQLGWYDLRDKTHTIINTCSNQVCSQPSLSPDSRYLAYTSGISIKEGGTGSGRVWILTLNGTAPIGDPIPASGNAHPTRDPVWSSNGWLAYYDDADAAFQFYLPSTGQRTSMENGTGEPGSWTVDGAAYLIPEIHYVDSADNAGVEYYSRLVKFDPLTGQKTDLTQNNQAEDLIPAFSPSGSKVAFARRFLNAQDWSPGRQVWVIDSDGSNPRNLTSSPDFNHLGFAWSPDDRTLAYLRFNTASLNLEREMWMMDTQTGLSQKVLMDAYRLEWLP
jgi:Tol biopolymer transport system component